MAVESRVEPSRTASYHERVGTLVNAVQRLSLARTIAEVQEIVRTTARELCGSDGATFVLRDGPYCYYADEDAISPLWKGQRFPLDACISGWAMLNRSSTAIPDIYEDDRIPHDAYRPTFVRSLAMVPIRRMDPVGAIGNYWSDRHVVTDEEMNLLQALADSTAVAMENVAVWGELESRVADRTAKLQEALALSDRLLATMAHEVRNPLSGARGLVDLVLTNDAVPIDVREHLEFARDAVAEGMRVVSEQLDLAKMRAGELRVRPVKVRPAEIVERLAGTYRAMRSDDRVALVTRVDPDLPTIETDVHLLGQALRNLVSNAMKFTDEGTVTISAATAPDAVVFRVEDTGIGIADADLERIFEEFRQVDADQAGRPAGTGLGLPHVRRIASLLGGTLSVESELERGSVFTLTVPA